MATQRIYEVMFIVDTSATDEEITRLNENLQQIITDQGGTITRTENMGRRQLAYQIGRKKEGFYVLFEVEGSAAPDFPDAFQSYSASGIHRIDHYIFGVGFGSDLRLPYLAH